VTFLIVEITVALGLVLFGFYLGYFLLMRHKAKGWKPLHVSGNFTPSVSIVVPTYNEEDTIVHKLKNLMEQDYPLHKVEVIVIDSASDDATVELLERFIKDIKGLKLKLIRESERKGKASALNNVLKHCAGEVVIITDVDVIWEKDTLKKIVLNFSNPNVGAVTGRQILLNADQSLATKVEKTYRSIFEVLRLGESSLDSTPIFNGPLMAFRLALLEPISEDCIADDSQLAVKIRKKGFKSVYDPCAVFYECAPPSFKSRFIQKVRRGQGLLQLFFREREILFNSSYRKFGTIIFPAEFFMHVISPVLVFAFLVSFFLSLSLVNPYVFVGLVIAIGVFVVVLPYVKTDMAGFLSSFLDSQFILFVSLIFHAFGKSQHKWTKISEVRKLWKERNQMTQNL
jgi:cellulose synthase/poly-beta-1,6-N-acetylglucosamine synthase-like glycosyltransferase